MKAIDDIKVIMNEKSWKKLAAFSVITLLIITVIVFFAAFEICRINYLSYMDDYLNEVPEIIDSFRQELNIRSGVFEEDEITRAELGLKLYEEDDRPENAENLEKVRAAVSAASLSLVNENRQVLITTGLVTPKDIFAAVIQKLEPRVPQIEYYPAMSEDGEKTDKNDGKGFVMIPVPGNAKRSLVFEFFCEPILEISNTLGDWSTILGRILYKTEDAFAYAKTGDQLAGYPLDDFTSEQKSQLYEELTEVFRKSGTFRHSKNGNSNKVVKLLGNRYLAVMTHYPQENTDILLTFPLKAVIGNGFFIAAAISAIIGWGIVLIRIYIFRCLRREECMKELAKMSRKQLWQETWPGILVVVLVTAIFSTMLLMLENRTNATYIAMSKRKTIQAEINYHKDQEKTIRGTYENLYRERAQILADYLMEHPDQQTHKGLAELNRIVGADYLMLFDSTGQELVSSNSYTGFTVGSNLSEEYRAVLLGYPYAIVGPESDPYTGKMQLGAAIMMTDTEGQPDGFFLAVYSAGNMDFEINWMSYENSVNTFAVQKGHIAAAISDTDGRFIAHTVPEMIGMKSEDLLEGFNPGSSFEGFIDYNGRQMCVSASSADGKTLLYMAPERWNSYEAAGSLPMILSVVVLLILSLVYYPNASVLIGKAIDETKKNFQSEGGKGSRIKVFYDGYDIFLTLFTFFVLLSSANGWWTSFDFVLSGKWSKGVNLFSIWSASLILVSTLFIVLMIRSGLSYLESRLSIRAKTITSLIKSLVTYTAVIFIIFFVLDILGVNTTTLLASAGVLSIAIGMGAKSMAEDMLAGFFMMTEGTIHVGDNVSVGNVTGHVTDMGIRTTEITDDQGNVVTLNNSKVTAVRNMSRNQDTQKTEEVSKSKG